MLLLLTTTLDINLGATTDDDRYVTPPSAGEWVLREATWVPATSVAQDGTDYRTINLKNGSNVIGTLTTSTVAWTAGTPKEFTLSGGKNREFTGKTDAMTVNLVKAGSSGKVADGALQLVWERVS